MSILIDLYLDAINVLARIFIKAILEYIFIHSTFCSAVICRLVC